MLLALGPLLLDTTVRTVVVGLVDEAGPASCAGADAVWLGSPTPRQVASTGRATGLPVGVTVEDVDGLDDLVAAGAVAVECGVPEAVSAARDLQLTMWCRSGQAERATAAGVAPEHIVRTAADVAAGVVGLTVDGDGPHTWGEVVRATHAGARVVRTTDVRSVRRVVTVMDRLARARAAAGQGVRR